MRGGGTFVWPAWEQFEYLSLRMMTLDIDLKHVYTVQGIPINVKAVAQVKVKGELAYIQKAAEGFLGMAADDIRSTIKETVSGHLRGIVGTLTVEELYRDQKRFPGGRSRRHPAGSGGHGIRVQVFRIPRDPGRRGLPQLAESAHDPGGPQERARRDRQRRPGREAGRGGRPPEKEQRRFAVDTDIAAAERELSMKKAAIKKDVDVAAAQAVKAGEMELKTQDILIAEKEVGRRKLELNATIREQADAKKFETERLADADQYRVERQAAAERKRREESAMALKAEGLAKAEAESVMRRNIGVAEGDAIRARGQAEAAARRLLAEALKLYNEAGLSIEALKVLPEIAAAISEPLSRAGSTTIISHGGNGGGTGAAKLTEDVTTVLSQLNPIMQQLAGVNLQRFLQDISRLPGAAADAASKPIETSSKPREEPPAKGPSR